MIVHLEKIEHHQYYQYSHLIKLGLGKNWYLMRHLDECEWLDLKNACEDENREAVIECAIKFFETYKPTNPTCPICSEPIEDDGVGECMFPYDDGEVVRVACRECVENLECDEKEVSHVYGSTCVACGRHHEDLDPFCKDCR